jgi:cell division protein FtsI/penicillin-binding protein 2
VASYLEEDSSCLVDKCIQGTYAPGSVFKVVVAAAALEKEDWENPEEAETSENSPGWTPETVYNCQGEILVEGVNLGGRKAAMAK